MLQGSLNGTLTSKINRVCNVFLPITDVPASVTNNFLNGDELALFWVALFWLRPGPNSWELLLIIESLVAMV